MANGYNYQMHRALHVLQTEPSLRRNLTPDRPIIPFPLLFRYRQWVPLRHLRQAMVGAEQDGQCSTYARTCSVISNAHVVKTAWLETEESTRDSLSESGKRFTVLTHSVGTSHPIPTSMLPHLLFAMRSAHQSYRAPECLQP